MLKVKISTPRGSVIEINSNTVSLPGFDGELQIMPDHVPIFVMLKPGIIIFDQRHLVITSGFAELSNDFLSIICEESMWPEEIDILHEQNLLEELEKKIYSNNFEDEKHLKLLEAQMESILVKIKAKNFQNDSK